MAAPPSQGAATNMTASAQTIHGKALLNESTWNGLNNSNPNDHYFTSSTVQEIPPPLSLTNSTDQSHTI